MAFLKDFFFTEGDDKASSNDGWVVDILQNVVTYGGNDAVLGKTNAGLGIGILIQGNTLYTGLGDDVVTGNAGAANGIGIRIESDPAIGGEFAQLSTGPGNDVVTGIGGSAGIYIEPLGTDGTSPGIRTDDGNDVVDALQGGFKGGGTVWLGTSNDVLKGFGQGTFYGDDGPDFTYPEGTPQPGLQDAIRFGTGVYTITGESIAKDGAVGITMTVFDFEQIGGTRGTLFDFADGVLTVNKRGAGTFIP